MSSHGASVSVSPATPKFEDTVTVSYTEPPNFKGYPVVYVKAFQNGQLVFARGGFPPPSTVQLGPSQLWQGGAAQGKATVGTFDANSGHEKILAEYDFPISA